MYPILRLLFNSEQFLITMEITFPRVINKTNAHNMGMWTPDTII